MKLTWEQEQTIREAVEWILDNVSDEYDAQDVCEEVRVYVMRLQDELMEQSAEPFDETVYFTEREML